MNFSLGWIFFLGGIAGFIRILRAKSLPEFSPNYDRKVNQDEATRAPMVLWVKLLLLGMNLLLVAGGAVAISRKHDWNPFAPCTSCKRDNGAVSQLRHGIAGDVSLLAATKAAVLWRL